MMKLKDEKKYGFGIDYMMIGFVLIVLVVLIVIGIGFMGLYSMS